MLPRNRQIFAYSGIIYPEPGDRPTFALAEHALSLAAGDGVTRVCYVPTAVGDLPQAVEACTAAFAAVPAVELSVLTLFTQPSVPDPRAHLLAQDMILVEGGSVVNLMAVWQAHGIGRVMRECWERGVVLAGTSAGSLCWHTGGPTDSYRDALDPFTGGLAFVPGSNGVHDDLPDQPRRETYRRLIAQRALPAGYASEDGVGLHYVGTELHEAVSIKDGKRAWRVWPAEDGGYAEEPIVPRMI